jgi:hypothetical protein
VPSLPDPPFNAASRLATAINNGRPHHHKDNVLAVSVWTDAFGIDSVQPKPRVIVDVTHALGVAMEQLQTVRRVLRQRKLLPEASYAQQLEYIERALDPSLLHGSWNLGPRKFLDSRESLTYLSDTLAHLLPPDEVPLAAEGIARFFDVLAEAERFIHANPTLDRDLRRLILGLLNGARRAMDEYVVGGASTLRPAYQAIVFGLAEYAPPEGPDTGAKAWRRVKIVGAALGSALAVAGARGDDLSKIVKAGEDMLTKLPVAERLIGFRPGIQPPRLPAKASKGNAN